MVPKLHIVDADTHVNEAADLWEKGMPSRPILGGNATRLYAIEEKGERK